jgi:protein-S-isoprenylcysteine O-methyltransferase Ste14
MNNLIIKALAGLLNLLIILAVGIFLPAWTIHYWQAWVFLAVFSLSVLAITVYLMNNDRELLERRVKAGPGAEKETRQKLIQSLAMISFIAVIAFPALDHRYGWSPVPAAISAAGDMLVVLGLFFVFLVFRENTYTSGIIEVGSQQKVIMTGPYAIVRHPMYIGALVMLIGVPLALGSWWGLLMVLPITLVIVWRLLDEEKFLAMNLAGYSEYETKVRYRLLPLIW